MLKSCADVCDALPLLVSFIIMSQAFTRLLAAVLSASYVEDLPAAVAVCLVVDDDMYV